MESNLCPLDVRIAVAAVVVVAAGVFGVVAAAVLGVVQDLDFEQRPEQKSFCSGISEKKEMK
jgi:hypothetical protein